MQIVDKNIEELIPYSKNPRKNDGAVEAVANSIKEFGFKVPIVIDSLKADTDYERVKFLFNTLLRERQLITYMKIKGCQTVGDNQVKA